MKVTRSYAEEQAKKGGWEPIQIDGIPEGFSYLKPDVTIGGIEHKGSYVAYIPLSDDVGVYSDTVTGLLRMYKELSKHGTK